MENKVLKLSPNSYLYFFVIGAFFIVTGHLMFAKYMFMDGLYYTTIARNIAVGDGTVWDMKFTNTFFTHFHEHPPLAMWLESLYFKVLGNSWFVDKFYSVNTYVFTAFFIRKIWKVIFPDSPLTWVVLLFWLFTPVVFWAVGNNMLENTLSIFMMISVYYSLKSVITNKWYFSVLAGFFIAMGLWAERQALARQNPLTRRDVIDIVLLGFIGYYLSSYLDFLGLQYVTASLERLILYLNPTLVLLLGWLIYKKPILPRRLIAMAISYSGVLLVFWHELSFAGVDVVWGSGLVFAIAFTYAIYLVYSGQLVQRIGSLRLVGWATSVACLCCLAQFAVLRPLSAAVVPVEVLWLGVLNAVLCTVAPVLMVMMAVERIGAALTAQTGMIGPMATITLGVWVLNEPLNVWIGAGTLLVLGGVFIVSKYGAK